MPRALGAAHVSQSLSGLFAGGLPSRSRGASGLKTVVTRLESEFPSEAFSQAAWRLAVFTGEQRQRPRDPVSLPPGLGGAHSGSGNVTLTHAGVCCSSAPVPRTRNLPESLPVCSTDGRVVS